MPTIEEYIKVGELRGLTFDLSSYNTKTQKGNTWTCSNFHKFKAPYTKIVKNKYCCPQCLEAEYGINISIDDIKKIFQAIFQDFSKKSFKKRNPQEIVDLPSYHRIPIDGYNVVYKIGFIFQRPQYLNYIPALHTEKAFNKIAKKTNDTIRYCSNYNILIVPIPYYIDKEDLFHYIYSQVSTSGYKIHPQETCRKIYEKAFPQI